MFQSSERQAVAAQSLRFPQWRDPYLNVRSAAPESGKSLLLEVLDLVVRKPWKVDGASPAALPVRNLLLDQGAIKITQSVWHGEIQTVKSVKVTGHARFLQLTEHLRNYLRTWRPNTLGLLFASKKGTPWDIDTVRKRKLHPLLDKLGIPRCGFHAFRHGNETVMDQENVPMAVRQSRLGHSDARTTMMYTYIVS